VESLLDVEHACAGALTERLDVSGGVVRHGDPSLVRSWSLGRGLGRRLLGGGLGSRSLLGGGLGSRGLLGRSLSSRGLLGGGLGSRSLGALEELALPLGERLSLGAVGGLRLAGVTLEETL